MPRGRTGNSYINAPVLPSIHEAKEVKLFDWARIMLDVCTVWFSQIESSLLRLEAQHPDSVTVTGDYTFPSHVPNAVLVCNNTAAITVTIPALKYNAHFTIIRANTGSVAIVTADTAVIIGETSQALASRYDAAHLRGTELGWFLV